ncbi:MAG: gamma-glutamyltransferase family protein [Chloroflexota bacterium]
MDYASYPYPSRRMPVFAPRGVVATSQPLAAQAGLAMLQKGGTAIDAVIATAAALTVLEPTSNGIGSDAFALIWDGTKLHGLNGSGRSPAAMSMDGLRAAGYTSMPQRGWWSVTVPGAPKTWADLHARYGKLPFAELFEPAIYYAEHGFAVSPTIARLWAAGHETFVTCSGPEYTPWFDTFAPNGRPPVAGERWRSAGHAATLRTIAASKAADYYEGKLAQKIAAFSAETGGLVTRDDLAAHTNTWVDPIGTSYRGYDVWEIPPNGQGIAALIGLNILEGTDSASYARESVDSYHLQIEAVKLGLADARKYVADMEKADVPVKGLLDKAYAAGRRALIGDRAIEPGPGKPPKGGTVYLCAADANGMMVSYIQSNFSGFGSGIVIPGTGIALQNRAYGFATEVGHRNQVAPNKRPFHTIIPAFLTHQDRAVGPFGVMGGHMQAQGHLQMMVNTLDHGMNPQASIDAPRWQWTEGRAVTVESEVDPAIVRGLQERGHEVCVEDNLAYGRAQIIWKLPAGGYVAGSEKRTDGLAAGY